MSRPAGPGRRGGRGTSVPRALAVLIAGGVAGLAAGCAPAAPLIAGGRTAPAERAEVGFGGATRIALGQLRARRDPSPTAEAARRAAWTGGTAPVASVRGGLGDGWDVGAVVAGTLARFELRRELVLQEGLTRVVALAGGGALVGLGTQGDDLSGPNGVRWGAELPLLVAADISGLGEVWAGGRVRLEAVRIDAAVPQPAEAGGDERLPVDGRAVQADLVVGYGWGFRNLHVLLELAAGHAWWWTELEDARGVVLTPSFVLRARL